MTKHIPLTILLLFILFFTTTFAYAQGPVIVPRDRNDPSIHEGSAGQQNSGIKQVASFLGLMPASYNWFGGVGRAIASLVIKINLDPNYLGFKAGQRAFQYSNTNRSNRLFEGDKGLGGQNITDTAKLGQPGSKNPGDPYWVAFPRPGNVEIGPAFQTVHWNWDCFCRWDELVACPTGSPPPIGWPFYVAGTNLHEVYGGLKTTPRIKCQDCFGEHNIRKHDYYVGIDQGPHDGYPKMASDTGYQECLRQSIESYAASGSGGQVQQEDDPIYGL